MQTAALDRNLACLGLVEVLYGYPLTGVLTTGCDKTTSACRQVVRVAPGRPDISHRCTGSHHDP